MAAHPASKPKIVYSGSGGKPLSVNTEQMEVMGYLYGNPCALFVKHDGVFVAADVSEV